MTMSGEGGNDDGRRQSAGSLLERELLLHCQSELLSEEGLRKIIGTPNHRYNLRKTRNYNVDDYEFFYEACRNERVTEGIIRCLLEYFPDAARSTDGEEYTPTHYICRLTPLHDACLNKSATLKIVQLLIDAAPDSVRSEDNGSRIPLHCLCFNRTIDEMTAMEILKFLLDKHSEAVRHASDRGNLPIHTAALKKSPEFCRVLIEAYPGSERIPGNLGTLPLHLACFSGSLASAEYVYNLYPDAIDHATNGGFYPIHMAMLGMKQRDNPAAAVEILQFLLNCDPDQKLKQIQGKSLLHYACTIEYNDSNIKAGIQIIKDLFDAHPASVRSVDYKGRTPLHSLCCNRKADEATAVQILKFILEKHPEAVWHANNEGNLPIHCASCYGRSPELCRVLIEAYPGSKQMTDAEGRLPLHWACSRNTIATIEYLYRRYPDAINHATTDGFYPIHYSISSIVRSGSQKAEIIRFLLDCDPRVKTQTYRGMSLLRYANVQEYNDSNIEAGMQTIKVIFDAHPEAIEDNGIALNIPRYHQQVKSFINNELVYARQAKDHRLMTTPDDNGQLPLHVALQNNARLGSIKLFVKGNPHALQSPDNGGELPLHVACQHHNSTDVFDYLVGLDPSTLDAVDREGNTALHFACRSAKYETITLLLEKYDAVSVSKRNTEEKLPIDLLWESIAVDDRGSVEYTGSVFQLLKAYPETVMNNNVKNITQQAESGVRSSHNEKKRKRDTVEK